MKLQTYLIGIGLSMSLAAQAATVDWRQGSGNSGANFTVASDIVDFANGGTGTLTLGLRAVQRGVGTIVPVGDVYHVAAGASAQANRAWWNFDIFAGLNPASANTGFDVFDVVTLGGLSSMTLQISTIGGSAPAAASFNLLDASLRSAIDCHVIGCVNGAPFNPDAGVLDTSPDVQNAAQFFNASQNPVFAPWFTAFDMNRSGLYDFTLSAVDQFGNEVSTSMRVNVDNYVPEPGSLALAALSLGLLAASLRRRQTR